MRRVGTDIEEFARICSVARVFDELQSNSPYSLAISLSEAKAKIAEARQKFDPKLLDVVMGMEG